MKIRNKTKLKQKKKVMKTAHPIWWRCHALCSNYSLPLKLLAIFQCQQDATQLFTPAPVYLAVCPSTSKPLRSCWFHFLKCHGLWIWTKSMLQTQFKIRDLHGIQCISNKYLLIWVIETQCSCLHSWYHRVIDKL